MYGNDFSPYATGHVIPHRRWDWSLSVLGKVAPGDAHMYRWTASSVSPVNSIPDSKVHGAEMGPIWDRQDPDGPMLAPWTFLSGISYIDISTSVIWIALGKMYLITEYSRSLCKTAIYYIIMTGECLCLSVYFYLPLPCVWSILHGHPGDR